MKKCTILIVLAIFAFVGCGSNSSSNNTSQDHVAQHTSSRHDQKNHLHAGSLDAHLASQEVFSVHEINASDMVAPLKERVLSSEVLNQGSTNTCVTMSLVAALGIVTQANSAYFDPVCTLNLGNYLHNDDNYENYPLLKAAVDNDPVTLKYYPSGWKGTTFSIALEQFNTFGIIKESGKGQCGNGSFYSQNNTHMVSPEDFTKKSHADLNSSVGTKIICSHYNKAIGECTRGDSSYIDTIKTIVDNKGLALLSFQIYEQETTIMGLDASFYQFDASGYKHNVWLYNDNVAKCKTSDSCDIGGHEIIVFGYIDDAEKPDEGIFVLRNSWGKDAGDYGNFYMTYEYVTNMILALSSIMSKK